MFQFRLVRNVDDFLIFFKYFLFIIFFFFSAQARSTDSDVTLEEIAKLITISNVCSRELERVET